MQKIATEILAKNPKGGIDALRAHVKQMVASLWYNHGSIKTIKQVREGGGRWCENCKSGTHNTDACKVGVCIAMLLGTVQLSLERILKIKMLRMVW